MRCDGCNATMDEDAFAIDTINAGDDRVEVLFRCPNCDIRGTAKLMWFEFRRDAGRKGTKGGPALSDKKPSLIQSLFGLH